MTYVPRTSARGDLERAHDLQRAESLAVLKVFGQQVGAALKLRRGHDLRMPPRKAEPVLDIPGGREQLL